MSGKGRENKQYQGVKKDIHARMSFPSEELLQQAIAGLLIRMPDKTGVQILQGTQELGKDIIFYSQGGFEELTLCACVVKNTRITGNVSKECGARTVLLQAEQCLDTPHQDGMGKDVKVEKVYVITPFDLPPTTIASIHGKLKERAGQVSFIGGAQLFDLFKRYWPDYFADEAEVIEQHLKRTENLYVDESPLPSLAFQYGLGDISPNLMKVYVSQTFYRELTHYEMGDLLTASLPSPNIFSGAVSRAKILAMKEAINRYDEALAYLNEWGFCSASYDPVAVANTLEQLINELLREWKRALEVASTYKSTSINIPVTLINATSCIAKTRSLIEERYQQLLPLQEQISNLRKVVFAGHIDTLKTLSSEEFQHACLLNDCAQAAPEKMFIATPTKLRVEYPKELHDKFERPLLIVGAPGFGKTSFCRWHALQDAEQFNQQTSNVLPVYIPLHQLARKPLNSFEDAFLKTVGQSALISKNREDLPRRIRIYLDGLDEVTSAERCREILSLLKSGIAERPHLQVVITSRDYIYGKWLDWLPKVNLSEFKDSEVKEFIEKWLGTGTETSQHFYGQLLTQPILRTLMRTPLLATLILMVFRQTRRLPENKARLYEIFIDLHSGGWDMAKGFLRGTKFGQRVKVIVLCALADKLHTSRRRECKEELLQEVIKASIPGLPGKDWKALRDEILGDGLINHSGAVLQFSHLSFQEYLAAKSYMGMPHSTRILRVLEDYLYGNDWWRDMLKFYIGLSSSPRASANWLTHNIKELWSMNYRKISVPHVHEAMAGVIEAFPEYPVEMLAEQTRGVLNYNLTLTYLQQVKEKLKLSDEFRKTE